MIEKEQVKDLLQLERDTIASILYGTPFYKPTKEVAKKILLIQKMVYEMLNRKAKMKKLELIEKAYQKVYEEALKNKAILEQGFSPEAVKKMFIFYMLNNALENVRLLEKSHLLLKSDKHAKTLLIENILIPLPISSEKSSYRDINFDSKIDVLRKLIAELVIEAA